MNLLSKREIAGAQLFTVEVSESELDAYRQLLLYALQNFKAAQVKKLLGDTPDEIEGLLDDVENILEDAGLLAAEKLEVTYANSL